MFNICQVSSQEISSRLDFEILPNRTNTLLNNVGPSIKLN